MKTKAIVATLLIAVAASADARFASPYPRKALSPDENGHWIVINGNSWSHDLVSELRIPTTIVVNETTVNDSKLLTAERPSMRLPSK